MPESREEALLRLLLNAYPDRVTVRREGASDRGVMVGGRGVILDRSSIVRRGKLFLSLDPFDSKDRAEARVSLASALEERWLEEVHPHLLKRQIVHRYDEERGKVVSVRQTLFAGLVIREDPANAADDPEGAAAAMLDHLVGNASELFKSDESAQKLLLRINFLCEAMPELKLPQFAEEDLKSLIQEFAAGSTNLDQIKRRGLRQMLESRLTWPQRQALDEHAPETIEVPSGSRIRLQYQEDSAPILPVRLQELFGMAETPRLAGGRRPVLLHLLGPNYRPVQVTSDLKNFWNSTYAEVRKELRARYPKHPWPEDPWSAKAVNVGGRRRH